MNRAQARAWDHLVDLEKQVLSLVIVSEKTKQEASIVLNIYPYKFTEIYNRAKKLFTVFTDYYDQHEDLVPETLAISVNNQLFVRMLLKNRRKPSELVAVVPEFIDLAKPGAIPDFWNQFLRNVQWNTSDHSQDFYKLLKIFDQWNNFRILPSEYRDPSPFPRRRNREFKKIHEQLNSISELGWSMIQKQYGTNLPPMAFVPVVGELFTTSSIRLTKNTIAYCTRNKIPLFSKETTAKEFAESSFDFHQLSRVSTYSAQKFWAMFRSKLQLAINHDDLLNIRPGDFRDFSTKDKLFLKRAAAGTTFHKALPRNQSPGSQFY